MKYLENLLKSIGEMLGFRCSQFCTNLPFRMKLGKFGMWLMKVGRVLQERYANWNSEFRMDHEFVPNPDMCIFHVSEVVTDQRILSFDSLNAQPEKKTPMVRELQSIKGLVRITIQPYMISIEKGRVFNWREILPRIDEVLLEHLTKKEGNSHA